MSILSQFKQSQNTDFPNVRPSLDLRFALAKKLDPRITFTRGTSGTYFGSDGLMKTAGANEPRFDHDPITGQSLGLLIEESRINLMTGSDDFGPLYWVKLNSVGVSTNVITAPDGTLTADKFTENTLGISSHKVIARNFTLSANTTYTFSIFVKAAERTVIMMHLRKSDYNTRFGGFFDLAKKTFTSDTTAGGTLVSSSITSLPNDWYRISLTGDIGANTAAVATLYLCNSLNSIGYMGDGTSGIYLWGAQLEQGAFPTSYIPTTASTVTRSADLASMTGTNFSSWYNQSEGSIIISTDKLYSGNFDAYRHYYKIDSGSNADQITAYILPGSTAVTNYGITNAGRQVNDYQQIFIGSSPTQFKIAQSVNSKYFFFTSSKGTTPPQLPSKSAPNGQNLSLATNMSRLFIGSSAGGAYMNSHIARFTYYPIQLTNQQLINLVS